VSVHFDATEMSDRHARACAAIASAGLDGMLLFKQESMYWLTGYDTFGFSMFQCMYVSSSGEIMLFTRRPDLLQARHTSNVEDIRIWVDRQGVDPAAELIRELDSFKLRGCRLGIELQSYGLKASDWRMLEPALAEYCQFEDASTLFDELRATKSDAEIACVRRAAELADDALDEAIELALPGAFEGDILAAMQGAVFRGGGDYAGNEFIIGSGPAAMLVRYFSGRRRLQSGDQLTLEFAGAYARYHAAMMRTILTAPIKSAHERMFKSCLDAIEACKEVLKPGATMGQVFAAHRDVMDAAGFGHARMNACGYGMGAVFNPLWVDPPMFYEDNPRRVSERNVFFLHMILMDEPAGKAMTLGETVLVNKDGCESLSRSPLELIVNQ